MLKPKNCKHELLSCQQCGIYPLYKSLQSSPGQKKLEKENAELKQRWEDLGDYLEMGKQIGRINGHSKPFCEILVKMEELSKGK